MAVAGRVEGATSPGRPAPRGPAVVIGDTLGPYRVLDKLSEGQRFVVLKKLSERPGDTSSTGFVVVQHWFEELMRLVPAK